MYISSSRWLGKPPSTEGKRFQRTVVNEQPKIIHCQGCCSQFVFWRASGRLKARADGPTMPFGALRTPLIYDALRCLVVVGLMRCEELLVQRDGRPSSRWFHILNFFSCHCMHSWDPPFSHLPVEGCTSVPCCLSFLKWEQGAPKKQKPNRTTKLPGSSLEKKKRKESGFSLFSLWSVCALSDSVNPSETHGR